MNKQFSSRKGSALLIVLGMVAFMVISAVAFSAFMRFSRLPSSYLRRSVASRMLAQAALASAIDEIDRAIGNHPHPGLNLKDKAKLNSLAKIGNLWQSRVYIGTTNTYEQGMLNDNNEIIFAKQHDTVATLSLEGLAYIPPPLVNEARYFSRHSWAATWHWMPYDSGRYAFCAIDVSDYLDINALKANSARTSNPNTRFSLAYLFDETDPDNSHGKDNRPKEWDTLMKQVYDEAKAPLVSMADWSLAVGLQSSAFTVPFYDFIKSQRGTFYDIDDAEEVLRQPFVTDSYFPPTVLNSTGSGSSADTEFDLADDANQPYDQAMLSNVTPSFREVIEPSHNTKLSEQLYRGLCGLGLAALYDYLDYNRVPCSLAVPTVERVPMICGLIPTIAPDFKLTIESDNPVDDPADDDTATAESEPTRTKTRTVKYRLKGFNSLKNSVIQLMYLYPFRHTDGTKPNFEFNGRASLFFTAQDNAMGLRTGNVTDALHVEKMDDLTDTSTKQTDGVISQAFSFGSAMPEVAMESGADPERARVRKGEDANLGNLNVGNDGAIEEFITVVYEWEQQKKAQNTDPVTYRYEPTFESAAKNSQLRIGADTACKFPALQADGSVDSRFVGNAIKNLLGNAADANALTWTLNMAFWAAVRYNDPDSGEWRVVDLAPACMRDDDQLNKQNNYSILGPVANDMLGSSYPLLRFKTSMKLDLTGLCPSATSAPTGPKVDPADAAIRLLDGNDKEVTALMVADPRYNHNPEDWFTITGSGLDEAGWLGACHRADTGASYADRRDGDIFMSVSDQGYLQSIYELANLPRLTEGFYADGKDKYDIPGEYKNPASYSPAQTDVKSLPASFDNTLNKRLVWRTYCPFPGKYREEGDDFERYQVYSKDRGFRINPYTDNDQVLMAAFANTPYEWRLAGTNEECDVVEAFKANGIQSDHDRLADKFNEQYAWNENDNGTEQLKWDSLKEFAEKFAALARANAIKESNPESPDDAWKDAWDDLNWFNAAHTPEQASKDLCAVSLDANEVIYDTDKKFLYGYWRECFAVKQQLFLIFVRSEPTMMGGGAIGATPPQLANRAVALVWRDPTFNSIQTRPHRTRVLFYHQFD